jgi:hypothetical protein
MERFSLLATMVSLVTGCAKPSHVTTVQSPLSGVFYTVETFDGLGPPDCDFTRVVAHLERGRQIDRKLVVDGCYLEISRITWNNSHDVTLCMEGGMTDSFRTEVTLVAGERSSETIHNHLREDCQTTPTASPGGG